MTGKQLATLDGDPNSLCKIWYDSKGKKMGMTGMSNDLGTSWTRFFSPPFTTYTVTLAEYWEMKTGERKYPQ